MTGFDRTTRRGVFGSLGAAALATLTMWSGVPSAANATEAGSYPAKEIVFIVPYPPGGNSDNLARIYADRLRQKLGATIVIENKPGGTTSLGTGVVAPTLSSPSP